MSSSAIGALLLLKLLINNLNCHLLKIKSNVIIALINHLIYCYLQQLPKSPVFSFLHMREKNYDA